MEKPAKKRLLVVDDNRQFSDLIASAFADDFEVLAAADGATGLAKCAEWRPDVVLLDVNMPAMNGVEFLRRMALDGESARIPVVVITASDFNGITESLVRRSPNVAAFLTKLNPLETVKERILKALDK